MKDLILFVFPTLERGKDYFEDTVLKTNPNLKKVGNLEYENEGYRFHIRSLNQLKSGSLRGLRPYYIFLTEDSNSSDYRMLLELVNGNHDKIKVVI